MKIEIFGKTACPYCIKATELLDRNKINYDYVDFFSLSMEAQETTLARAPGAHSYPIILIDDVYVGGFDNINAAI